MLDHVGFEVSDYERSRGFYERAPAPLGIEVLMEPADGVCGFGDQQKPYFWIARRGDSVATDVHVAFAASSRERVDAFHAAALEAGATDNGAPGRPGRPSPGGAGACGGSLFPRGPGRAEGDVPSKVVLRKSFQGTIPQARYAPRRG